MLPWRRSTLLSECTTSRWKRLEKQSISAISLYFLEGKVTDGISAAYRKQKHYKVLARHKWASGTTLTESIQKEDDTIRRFTATILGWQNFKLYEGKLFPELSQLLVTKLNDIKNRIESGDEAIFESDVLLNQKYNKPLNSEREKSAPVRKT